EGIDARNRGANAAVGIAHLVAEDLGRIDDQRKHGKGHQRQLPVHVHHDGEDEGEDEDVLEDRDHAGGEHLVECVDVGGNVRDQSSYRILVEEGDVHVLQVAKDLAAQVEHDLLAGPLHQVGLDELEGEG